MLHVLFNESDITRFKEVQELDPELDGPIVFIRDDYAVGPLQALDTAEGVHHRLAWWKSCYEKTAYGAIPASPVVNDAMEVAKIQQWLVENPSGECWIWMAQNQHDVSGYYWVVAQLKNWQGRIQLLFLNNLPFLNEKGQLFYPHWLEEIPAKEFLKAKKLVRPVSASEFEIDPDEWNKLMCENAGVRIVEGGKKLLGKEFSYFDADIKRLLTTEWQRALRVVTQSQTKMKVKTGDVFLQWRLVQLAKEGLIETNEKWEKGWKELDIRLRGGDKGSTEQQDQ
ncbi:MAG: DUF1835 domain-containing protein [Bacteroidetes bacterium]|nr:DUF1835 domain-containing protein [Bacteroidota bacterium]